jgi:hypothetical protein
MSSTGGDFSAIEAAMLKYETLERLKRAIDDRYRRLIESAKEEWERTFAGHDPSDACVNVRVNSKITEAPGATHGHQFPGQMHLTTAPPNGVPPGGTC